MRYQTEMMRSILTNKTAQRMIDYISPIYGESYVGLWILQAIGTVMGEVYTMAENLRHETNPATAELLLDMWEDHYGIPRNNNLNTEQRRARIIAKTQSRAPSNPVRLASMVSTALGGVLVEITENIAKNTFLVIIREVVDSLSPAIDVVERMKPAHLIYEVRVTIQTTAETRVKTAVATTYHEAAHLEVKQQ